MPVTVDNNQRCIEAGKSVGDFIISSDPESVTLLDPGLSLLHLSSDGNIRVPLLLQHLDGTADFIKHHQDLPNGHIFLDFPELIKGCLLFLSAQETSIAQQVYGLSKPTGPFYVRLSLGNLGKSSYCLNLAIFIPGERNPLLDYKGQAVLIDMKTRKPKEIPEKFKRKYDGRGTMEAGLRIDVFVKPKKTFCHKVKVVHIETDSNNHTNFASYYDYVFDGIKSALSVLESGEAVEGLPMNAGAYLKTGVKQIQTRYIKESLVGEELSVFLWQDSGSNFTMKSCIEREGQILFQIKLEYYGTLSRL